MGYRDDFFIAVNMIGYSGNVQSFPTVYFQKGEEYGHITQAHGRPQNVGRGTVHSHPKYSIKNEMTAEGLRLREKRGDRVFHTSRSIFTTVERMTFDDQAVILQAVWQYPNEKYISGYNREIRGTIKKANDAKSRMHVELLG